MKNFALFFCFIGLFSSCALLHITPITSDGSTTSTTPKTASNDSSLEALGIPKGHLPPPGKCKIWYPNRPAGQQPPPTSCEAANREAKGNHEIWVISRSESKLVEVRQKGGTVIKRCYVD